MISYEDHEANKQLLFAIELKTGGAGGAFPRA